MTLQGEVRRPTTAPGEHVGAARVDRRTKRLTQRCRPGDIAVIDHEDIDRVSAEALVGAGVAAVVNAAPSTSGRYPNLGPAILIEAGIPLIDGVGPLLLRKVSEGDTLTISGDRVLRAGATVAIGQRQDAESVSGALAAAERGFGDRFEGFARNTVEFAMRERDLLFGGVGLPDVGVRMNGRPVLVVVRGYGYREDLAALRPYIRERRPVLVGVDGGADALLDSGYVPDVIVGDMDSVSDDALGRARQQRRRRHRTAIVLHAYADGRAPGRERLERMEVPYVEVRATGTSEDLAFLLAHERGAETIVAVGTHANLREFLDKGREGMASTFLTRLRVGEILMDAKGVSRIYAPRVRAGDSLLLVGAALFVVVAIVLVSPPLRLYATQLLEAVRDLLFHIRDAL